MFKRLYYLLRKDACRVVHISVRVRTGKKILYKNIPFVGRKWECERKTEFIDGGKGGFVGAVRF